MQKLLTAKTIIGEDRLGFGLKREADTQAERHFQFGFGLKCESFTKAERHFQILWAVAIGVIFVLCMVQL